MLLDALGEVSKLDSTILMRKFGILAIPPPSRRIPGWVEMAKILHFLVIVVDLGSETSHSTFNSTGNGHALH